MNKFKVGDRVEVTEVSPYTVTKETGKMLGVTGTIRACYGGTLYEIIFDDMDTKVYPEGLSFKEENIIKCNIFGKLRVLLNKIWSLIKGRRS